MLVTKTEDLNSINRIHMEEGKNHPYLLAIINYNELLVWLKASSFCYTIHNGLSLGLLLDILLSYIMVIFGSMML